jgi:transcriptional regulator with XRE-family HTH domain
MILLGNRNNETFHPVARQLKEPKTEIGRRLVAALTTRGWTQQELARRSGVSQSFISQLRTGDRRDVSTAVLAKLEAALAIPGLRLAGGDGGTDRPIGIEEFLGSDLARDVTDYERRILEQAAWALPPGKVATKGDWYTFLRWMRGLPDSPDK